MDTLSEGQLSELTEIMQKYFGGGETDKKQFCAKYASTPSVDYHRFAESCHRHIMKNGNKGFSIIIQGFIEDEQNQLLFRVQQFFKNNDLFPELIQVLENIKSSKSTKDSIIQFVKVMDLVESSSRV